MPEIKLETGFKRILSDVYTPVGIYLRLRDRFRDTILLESTDFHLAENCYSIIAINAIAGIEVTNTSSYEYKYPGVKPEKKMIRSLSDMPGIVWNYFSQFKSMPAKEKVVKIAQSFFGYTTYDAVRFFETVELKHRTNEIRNHIPLMRYRLYQYVIVINHFKDEMFICENKIAGLESEISLIESLIKSKDVPVYPFSLRDRESGNMGNETYLEMVRKGIRHCLRGDVFQIVLSRYYGQSFAGDEFNVYRALRSINPSPYLFYFDYGDYKLFGSSPESQLIMADGKAIIHPIAGTIMRTGNDEEDHLLAAKLKADKKENAEHTMLVDLARNDLSRYCSQVSVEKYREVQYYSHVIHLVSEVTGNVRQGVNPFDLLAATFPAGTLSGAPKYRAMQLIDELEPTSRSFYGGCIGSISLDGSCNQAIMIRTFLSSKNTLYYQAGGGVVAASKPEGELQEVNNKLAALKKAIEVATTL